MPLGMGFFVGETLPRGVGGVGPTRDGFAIPWPRDHLKDELFPALTYLRLSDKRLGYLINFGAELIKDGLPRVSNGITA